MSCDGILDNFFKFILQKETQIRNLAKRNKKKEFSDQN